MEEEITVSFDQLYRNLNLLYSINFLALENQQKITSNILFLANSDSAQNKKDNYDEILDIRLKYFASKRNSQIQLLNQDLRSVDWRKLFESNSSYLLSSFNNATGSNLKYNDYFSSRLVNEDKLLTDFYNVISTHEKLNPEEATRVIFLLNTYDEFYSQYKKWISISDIFEALTNDVTSYGNQSFTCGITIPNGVKTIDLQLFNQIWDEYKKFAIKALKNKKRHIDDKKMSDENFVSHLKILSTTLRILKNRANAATQNHLARKSNLRVKIEDFIYSSETNNFKLDRFYIHDIEIKDLIESLSQVDELKHFSEKLSAIYYPENVNNSQITTKENT